LRNLAVASRLAGQVLGALDPALEGVLGMDDDPMPRLDASYWLSVGIEDVTLILRNYLY
jgi:hypothetical protein